MKQLSAASSAIGNFRKLSALTQAAILAVASLLPLLALASPASADQLTARSVTISDSEVSATAVQYDFAFTIPSSTDVEGVILQFCTAPLGACTLPSNMVVDYSAVALDSVTGITGGFAEVTANTGDCNAVATSMYCIANASGAAVSGAATVDLSGVTNPDADQTVYIRIALYTDEDFGSGDLAHNGTVAAAIEDQLQISGRVQERLDFCVTAVGDADSLPASVSACSALTDQNVDIGVITEGAVSVAPVDADPLTGADDDYGILMVNTNAGGGVVLSYFADPVVAGVEAAGGETDQLRSFRVRPTDCNPVAGTLTDQCFVSANGAAEVITLGNELFGMYVPCVDNTQSTVPTANLTVPDAYNGDDDTITSAGNCEAETFSSGTAEVAWNATGTAATVASSTTVVDDEIVKLRFAATASPTTPSGNYTVVTTYIATATF